MGAYISSTARTLALSAARWESMSSCHGTGGMDSSDAARASRTLGSARALLSQMGFFRRCHLGLLAGSTVTWTMEGRWSTLDTVKSKTSGLRTMMSLDFQEPGRATWSMRCRWPEEETHVWDGKGVLCWANVAGTNMST
eukprot:13156878-Alexandrium_andersonii.AAC.1